ncbi:ferredoxin [Candidatus Woesearchaeota archaeon]|nr:ferredoxin [Candidatus Woesearchaeota archaeon]
MTEQAQMTEQKSAEAGKYKLEHDRPNCIGCAACAAVAPKFWTMHEDGKSDIVGCKNREDGWEELGIAESDFQNNKEAAESCPVNVIHITNKETGEKII